MPKERLYMAEELAIILYKLGCVKIGSFKLTSGMWSPIYIDLRRLPSHPEEFDRITDICARRVKDLKFDLICGIATGGIPLAAVVAFKLKKPFIYARKEEKRHGLSRLIEGDYTAGSEVLIIDDVATTGGTLERVVKALRNQGLKVSQALVVVDREQGARERLSKLGVALHALTTLKDIVAVLFRAELISSEDYERVMKYLRGESDVV
ncbi:MAG: orotate phosphoribosyltransferase [Thermoprotei archaeon]|nr:MAG: orotate phosphoribosyltransferase [Thermoprotei archaeon]RLF24715.1 MAG: orotate phosphoribosyltransferase [Thermoprotei archaeon]